MSGSETTTLGIGQAALSLPAASEAPLKPPMWTCVNFLSESYISRGGGSLAWFRGHGPDYGWRPSTHMRRKPLIPGGIPRDFESRPPHHLFDRIKPIQRAGGGMLADV